ncbi:AAA family ATPase [Conexibacter stalactiti]|uniref:AAA family ATPase n=1 Tax=Conexibacter stalactiti TaxID=1940611 RepID=A0ABU4HVT7_9ACTN|nr:AAA family ATPase [Conexibacter stalactiti]MDW5597438.1 AAA family ATPase [Conexibacter stalactiti]MEC5038080.1 AAA family ATPase [Conexibacter stalactiti]
MPRAHPIPALHIHYAHGLLVVLERDGPATAEELVEHYPESELFKGTRDHRAPVARVRQLLAYAAELDLVERDRDGRYEISDGGAAYVSEMDFADPFRMTPAQSDRLARLLWEHVGEDGVAFGAALALDQLAADPNRSPEALGAAIGEGGGLLGRWRSRRTFEEQGRRYRALLEDAALIDADGRLAPEGHDLLTVAPVGAPPTAGEHPSIPRREINALPLDLVFKWSPRIRRDTIELHRDVALQRGAVWWGRFRHPGSPLSSGVEAQLRDQLTRGVPTTAYLRGSDGAGDWKARLLDFSSNGAAVDPRLVPRYYEEVDETPTLWVKLTDFAELSEGDLLRSLVKASDGSPVTPGGLGNQTNPLYVKTRPEASLPAPPRLATNPVVLAELEPDPEPEPALPPLRPVPLSLDVFEAEVARDGLIVDRSLLAQLLAHVESGKHVILTGPPGTAKTTLAQALARAAARAEWCRDHVVTTATADWTTYETIGGLHEIPEGGLDFQDGHFLEAIRSDSWLVIDELNRSQFDRAFGALFTVLSGHPVVLPHRRRGRGRIALVPERSMHPVPAGCDLIAIPEKWRIVATMNVFDKALLFQMSFALMRRFAFVEVPAPAASVFSKLITDAADGNDEAAAAAERLYTTISPLKQLGPSVYLDLTRFLRSRLESGEQYATAGELMLEAFYSYLLPQFEGIDQEDGNRLCAALLTIVAEDRRAYVEQTLSAVLGIVFGGGATEPEEQFDDEVA